MGWKTKLFVIIIGLIALNFAWGIGAGYLGLAGKTVSAQNFERNYEWFKAQETAMLQIKSQICTSNEELEQFKQTYGDNGSAWSNTLKDQFADLNFVKRGYISKYNSLVATYNARRASFIQVFGRDPQTPALYAEFYESQC